MISSLDISKTNFMPLNWREKYDSFTTCPLSLKRFMKNRILNKGQQEWTWLMIVWGQCCGCAVFHCLCGGMAVVTVAIQEVDLMR